MTNLKVRIGRRIVEAREIMGWEQKELAAQLGVPPSTLNEWENGNVNVKWEWLERIARVTGREVSYLLPGSEVPDLALALEKAFPELTPLQIREVIEYAAYKASGQASIRGG